MELCLFWYSLIFTINRQVSGKENFTNKMFKIYFKQFVSSFFEKKKKCIITIYLYT